MKKIFVLLHFYRRIFILPLMVSFMPIVINLAIPFAVIILTKIMLFGVIWFFKYVDDREDKKFYFYYNNGLSKTSLFLFSFCIDLTLALMINYVL